VFGKHSGMEMICNNLFMCGRYRLSRRKQIIEEHFDTISGGEDWTPRYNVARPSVSRSFASIRKSRAALLSYVNARW